MAVLCEPCWNSCANELAAAEGATNAPRPEPGDDDLDWYEPPRCGDCGAEVECYPTNYDRWILLSTTDVRAGDVPPGHRWRLETVRARHSNVPVAVVAVLVRGIPPRPGDLVRAAHRASCLSRGPADGRAGGAGAGGEGAGGGKAGGPPPGRG